MEYREFLDAQKLSKEQLLAWAYGSLVSDETDIPSLPAPPMLMFDRITCIEHDGRKGRIIAEQNINLDAWFFMCHFRNDPVQPGCLGVDAIWQLLGMYCALRGAKGNGRALGSKEIEFFGQIRPHNKVVTYDVKVRRYTEMKGTAITIGNAQVLVDGEVIYTIGDAKVGVFPNLRYADYPNKSENAVGGSLASTK